MKKPTHRRNWITLTTFAFLLAIPLSRAQVFVNAAATGANDGTSWSDAYNDLTLALTNTSAGEIWVAAGAYQPVDCNPCSEPEKETSFQLPPDVQLYGGFEGTETALSQRDFDTHLTILSGDIGVPVDSTDNSYKVIVAANATGSTVLDGFIIEEGNADGSFGFSSGGGLYIDASNNGTGDIQVRNCTFRENYGGGGGGVAIDCVLGGQSNALFQDCLFEGNTASLRVVSTGAAVFMQGNSGAQLEPRFVRCTFRDNYSGNDGGAVSATPTGAGSLLAFEIDSCLFTGNRADDRGGAIWYRMSSDGESRVVIKNSRFRNNEGGGQGGAVYARSSFGNIASDTILNCVFRENATDGSSTINEGEGGAIFLRGSQEATRNHHIINCLFDRNRASERGGAIGTTSIVASPGTLNTSIINCTFYGNFTEGEGGAIHAEGTEGMNTGSLINGILWGDTAVLSGMEILNNGADFTVAYSNIAGGLPPDVTDGGNNLQLIPGFADAANGDLHLTACSPLINAGNNVAVLSIAILDLDGDPRIFQDTVDMGAYEIGVRYVDRDATGSNNGRSWTDAFTDLQDALAAAQPGDQIWVAEGTYFPIFCTSCMDVEMQKAFRLISGVEMYGGFNATETELSQRDWNSNATILSGDIGALGDSTDNSFKVLIAENVSDKTVLDGFIVEEGNADGSFGFSSGGGLYIDANPNGRGDIQVHNCTFRENYGGGGGGVAIDCVLGGQSNALFQDCLFERNTASLRVVSTGAAVFMQGNSGAQLKPRFVRCTFRDNYSGNDGGAVSATPTGAGSLLAFEIDSCLFTGNRADDRGGAIWYRMSSDGESRVVIKNSRFRGNESGGQGGAIYARSSFGNIASDTILNCVFRENATDGSSTINEGEGGAIFLRGSQEATRNHHIINCLFDRNRASERGGAIGTTSIVASPGTLNTSMINCTFYGNSTDGEGGAIHAEGTEGMNTGSLINSILWGDTAALSGMEIFNNAADFTVAYSDIDGGLPPDVTDGGNNLLDDPQFVDPANSDFRISSCSPARDTGLNTALPQDLSDVDMDGDSTEQIDIGLDGENRIFGITIDLGAFEWNGDPPEMTLSLAATDVSCNGFDDGQAAANPSGGVGVYFYQWSNGEENATITGLEPGIYAVTVTDTLSCTLVDSVSIIESEALMVTASSDTAICAGESLTLFAEGAGGSGAYSFNWDNGLGAGPEQEVAPADTTAYTVTITDDNGCLAEDTVMVSVNELPEVQILGSTVLCPGSATTLESSGTFESYLWQDSISGPSLEVTTAGLYSLTVTDINGCEGTAELLVEEGESLMPMISGALSFCAGDSTVLGAGEFASYLWSTEDTTQQLMASEAGSYSLTVSDASGCEGEAAVEVQENALPEVEIVGSPVFCIGGSTILESSGTFESYLWADSTTMPSLEVSVAGLYGLTVTDANGCEGIAELLVEEGESLMPTISGSLTFCAGESTVLNGGEYASYLWSTGDTTQQLMVSEAGSYSLTVSDASGCEGEATVEVQENALPEVEIVGSPVFCIGGSTILESSGTFESYLWVDSTTMPSLEVSVAGLYGLTVTDASGCEGTAELLVEEGESLMPMISGALSFCAGDSTVLGAGEYASYLWSTEDTTQQLMVSEAGSYSLTVSDASGCVGEATVEVQENALPEVEIVGSPVFCTGSSTTLESSGTYESYLWQDSTTAPSLEATAAGLYSLTVTDINGCAGSAELLVEEGESLMPTISGALSFCAGDSTVLGAGEYFSYLWSTGDTTQQLMVSEAGNYGLTVSDASGCEGEATVEVQENALPEVEIVGSPVFCIGGSTILEFSGTFESYLWADSTTMPSLEVSVAGLYGLTVTDANGCEGIAELLVEEGESLMPTISGSLTFCAGESTVLNGGEYASYLWSTGDTTQQLMVSEAGNYGLTVSDASGCEGEAAVEVQENALPEVEIVGSPVFCIGGSTILESSGTFESYLWADSTTMPSLEVSVAGLYGLTVTDANGCEGIAELLVEEGESLMPTISGSLTFCAGESTVLNGGEYASYLWTTGDTTQQLMVSEAGSYGLTVSDASGCSGEATVVVTTTAELPAAAGPDFSSCSDTVYLSANLPEGTSGAWSTTGPAVLNNLLDSVAMASELTAGANLFVWTLSAPGCPEYSRDSIQLTVVAPPLAMDDQFVLNTGDGLSGVFDLLANDQWPQTDDYEVRLLTEPVLGRVDSLEEGFLYYQISTVVTGQETIAYELCSAACPEACSEALLTLLITKEEKDMDIPNGITPNGDGLNDTFVFDIIELSEPEDLPDNRLIIFNRWGDIVYEKADYDNTWNGVNDRGEKLPHGTYYYVLYLNIAERLVIRGDVTIID